MSDGGETRYIQSIQFGTLSPHEIRTMSVIKDPTNPDPVGITEPVTYENNKPKRFGLCDLRMGPTDRHYQCETCRSKIRDCPGHSGHIELNRNLFHPGFLRYVQKVLQCVCFYCSAMLLPRTSQRILNAQRIENKQQRLRAVSAACAKVHRCRMSQCDAKQPKITIQRQTMCISARFPLPTGGSNNYTNSRFIINPEKARSILKRIRDDDCYALGLHQQWCRPEWMVLEALHVPPPCVRPSVVTDSARGEDDLTRKLVEIIKANNDIRAFEENEQIRIDYKADEENLQILQFHVALYFDNECYGKPLGVQRGGTTLKTLKERLKGKEGRFRANLNGKRVNFSARCVISPDPSLSINEVRLPRYVCQILTYPERVTPFNFDRLYALVRRGPHAYPGARYVIKKPKDGAVRHPGDMRETLDLRYCDDPARVALEYGDIVERHLTDGDLVLFNRQPSLHKFSMMGHRVRVGHKARTFGMNPGVTPPYNAGM